jgi:gamma-glutamylcyclotransferase (GGCT)/AIG2-like uncharacterized protein YtfP
VHFLADLGSIVDALRWVLSHLKAHKDAITVIVLVPGAIWTFWLYRKSKKKESAEWLHKLFTSFYLSKEIDPLRTLLEFDAEAKLRPLIERMLIHEDADATDEERKVLRDIDTLLNYFEFILYLESQGQIERSDCEQLFAHWFSFLKKPDLGYLRLYCHRFGYEGICQKVTGAKTRADAAEYVAFYGSLMMHEKQEELKITDSLLLIGPCEIPGTLYDLGDYPGLVQSGDRAKGQLYQVRDPAVLSVTDEYEEFNVRMPGKSSFVRHFVRLCSPLVDAWVYFYNGDVSGRSRLGAGTWRPEP